MVDFLAATYLGGNIFYGSRNVKTLILRSETVCDKQNSALYATAIANKEGYIYVPRALVDTYKAATNWSAYAAQFRALEEYTVDGTITGALDESKI